MMLSGIDIAAAYARWKSLQEIREEIGEVFVPNELGGPGSEYNGEKNVPMIGIDPFDPARLNPNSYNLRLAPEIVVYDVHELDIRKKPKTVDLKIPEEGMVLLPGELYLGHTMEYTESWNCVPGINGRSSTGRLGLSVHITAGFGDVGFCGTWTLEMTVVKPLRVYAGMEVCQINYHTVSPDHSNYKGKYLGGRKPMASAIHEERSKNG